MARGESLVFLDADVRVHAQTLERLRHALDDASVAAAFGSYDARPEARSWISVYKNLAHHFVHQRSAGEAATFWAGCGIVRASVFRDMAGFDESYRRPSIEDVELGYRLRAAGHRILLLPEAQGTHLKEWSLRSWLRADLLDRAVPWARLLAQGRGLPGGLNFTRADRLASGLVAAGLLGLVLSPFWPLVAVGSAGAFGLAIALDAPFLGFCARQESKAFAVASAGLQLLHRATGLLGLGIGLVLSGRRVATLPTST
jgi:tetrahydromethanopterin S-methyltransferase subunit F